MIELELLSGGNIRFEEIKVDSDQGPDFFWRNLSDSRVIRGEWGEILIKAKMIILICAKSLSKITVQQQGRPL